MMILFSKLNDSKEFNKEEIKLQFDKDRKFKSFITYEF